MPDTTPSLAGFTTFCRNVAGITTDAMPANDPGFQDALTFALAWVPLSMQCMSGLLYTACVYNLGVSMLVNYQPDQEGQTFFTTLRSTYKVSNFVPGVVTNTSDNGETAPAAVACPSRVEDVSPVSAVTKNQFRMTSCVVGRSVTGL